MQETWSSVEVLSNSIATTDGSCGKIIKKSSKSDPKKPAVKSSVSKKSHQKSGNNNAKRKTALRQKSLKKSPSYYVVDHVLSCLNEEGEVDDDEEFGEDGQSEPGQLMMKLVSKTNMKVIRMVNQFMVIKFP
jgi:hypothetical protein